MSLANRHILLGVTGGIAAYKAAELARLFVTAGADVRVVMTRAAGEFVGAMTFQALTGNETRSDLFDSAHEAAMGHIELARWADLVLVAPATANFIASMAHGRADDLLSTLCLATAAPVAVAPAMNRQMWADEATRANIVTLEERGRLVWGPGAGEQACGEVGPGRMLEPPEILDKAQQLFTKGDLAGVRALVTAGPTHEAIDPVRFIGNRSSGKMGFAIARALEEQGAAVTLVAGPCALPTPSGIGRIDVNSALEMHGAVMQRAGDCDLFVATAAVADYRPADVRESKIKKDADTLELRLVRNPDILAEVATLSNAPFTVGFAAETDDIEAYADDKRRKKGLDMIAANAVGGEHGGFDSDENALLVLWEGGRQELPMTGKLRLARQLVDLIGRRIHA
ncbi:MAG: bifunctional phosphopantothenoylcysteine decarboxylase/phosphopantothenate--cysteine ligase CoaBC [Gammaproteobacteria bacterium]|jgi:phosphopantothenoylcysteine decarboxylase / phosphopantothenate---cysteine ligase